MPAFFSSDGSLLLQFLVIFAVIAAAMGAVYGIYRRIAGRGLSLAARAGNRARQPRLGIVDIYELDRQRQLILLRRDNVEHLLLVGGPNDVVVERNVQRGGSARLPSEPVLAAAPEQPAEAPQPSLPPFQMPVVVPEPGPILEPPAQERAPRLDPALFEPDAAPSPAPAENSGTRAHARRLLRRTPPPLVNPRPDVASERPRLDVPSPPPPAPSPGEPRAVDPKILSDMARQLENALRRPSSAVTPPPGERPPASPAPRPEPPLVPEPPSVPESPAPEPEPEPRRSPDPVAAGMAASQVLSPAVALPEPSPAPASPPDGAPEPEPAAAPPPSPPEPPAAVEVPKPAPPPPPPPPEPPPIQSRPQEPRSEPQPAVTPFSVEEIEAEFARLLGRPLDKKG